MFWFNERFMVGIWIFIILIDNYKATMNEIVNMQFAQNYCSNPSLFKEVSKKVLAITVLVDHLYCLQPKIK